MNFLKELLTFLKIRKKLWLAPVITIMVILGGFLILAEGSILAPFIYTLFQESIIYILGLSAYYHDSAACLLKDSKIIAAAQEERFTRKKHDPEFPARAIKYCLEEANIKPDQLKFIVFYDKPFLKFERFW